MTILLENFSEYKDAVKDFNEYYLISSKNVCIDFLNEILMHFSNIPYENLSKIIKLNKNFDSKEKIRLPLELIYDHLSYSLGGTCFSVTFFLKIILQSHGFKCYPVMADMHWGSNVHCALVLSLNSNKYLIDPGYLFNKPIELSKEKTMILKTNVCTIELKYDHHTDTFNLITFNEYSSKWRYRFIDFPINDKKFLNYWLKSFEWNSMNGICIAAKRNDRMIYIHKYFMRESTYSDKKNFNLKKNIHEIIYDLLKIDPEKVEEALSAIKENKKINYKRGIWVPKTEERIISET